MSGPTDTSSHRRTVLVHHDRGNPSGSVAAGGIAAELRNAGLDAVEGLGSYDPGAVDVLLLLGGDGFLMDCLHVLNFPPTPVFGVNFGSVGFLMNPRDSSGDLVEMLRSWSFREERHAVLQAHVTLEDGTTTTTWACNDFVIERLSGQSIRIELHVDGVFFNHYSGDGLVLCTSAGSTAYNLAAGGPVLHPDLQAMVLTPLYPHRAAPFHSLQFSLLVPLSCQLRILADDSSKRGMRLLADGRPMRKVSSISIRDSGRCLHLLRTPGHNFYTVLSRKFIGETNQSRQSNS